MTKIGRERLLRGAEFLRNPKLKQAKGTLRGEDGCKCCLGHFCEFYRKETGRGRWVRLDGGKWAFKTDGSYTASSGILPVRVVEWFGLKECNPMLTRSGFPATSASHLNDTIGLSLPEIADLFEVKAKKGLVK